MQTALNHMTVRHMPDGAVLELAAQLGCIGPVSIERFAPDVHALDDPAEELQQSFDFMASRLAKEAA